MRLVTIIEIRRHFRAIDIALMNEIEYQKSNSDKPVCVEKRKENGSSEQESPQMKPAS